ncbi:hypothetical protein [Mycobacterium sp. E3198]|uniref:hypothetical protein n=1 Tax=Mycobacterium sp. E3198 TaxID=1834143 RepID=UPI0007FF5172|nr:hypothetical protein [Mycobacterium sp. E3198]OBG25434.1 hypothetical protein A5673_09110 [Mycobacterium sp. E3198]
METEQAQATSDTPPDPAPAEQPDHVGVPVESEHGAEPGSGRDREAAKFRKQLRAEQAARQADNEQSAERITVLERQLDALRRDQVGAIATTLGIKPAALWASGAQLDDLLGEDGAPDPDKVRAAVEHARAHLGITRDPRPFKGLRSGTAAPVEPVNRWRAAFAPREK